jgi:N-acetylneuraminic acid mutarotase
MNRILLFMCALVASLSGLSQKIPAGLLQWRELTTTTGKPLELGKKGLAGMVGGSLGELIIAGGGSDFPNTMPWDGGKKAYYDQVYVWEAGKDGKFMQKLMLRLPQPIAYAASCVTSKGIIYAGGENSQGLTNEVVLMKADQSSQGIVFEKMPSLPEPLANAGMICFNDRVYLAGGEGLSAVSDKLFMLDIDHPEQGWLLVAKSPYPVSHMVMALQKTKMGHDAILLLGGRKKNSNGVSDLFNTVISYDLVAGEWTKMTPLPFALSAGTGVAINDHTIAVLGGDQGKVFHEVEKLMQVISTISDPAEKEKLSAQKKQLQLKHPGFSNEVLMYNTRNNVCEKIGNANITFPVTAILIKKGNKICIAGGETKPGIRSPKLYAAQF